MEIEYVLNYKPTFQFSQRNYQILIGGNKESYNGFSDDEISEYISDALTHEYIHKIIYDLFKDDTLCKLFDAVQQYFRNTELLTRIFEKINHITWNIYIDRYGFDDFLEHYHIDENDVNDSFILSNIRW